MRALPRSISWIVLTAFSVLFLVASFALPAKTFAYETAASPYLSSSYDSGVAPTLHNYMQEAFYGMLSSVSCILSGVDPLAYNHECLGFNSNTGKLGFVKDQGHGLIGFLASGSDFFINNPPAHTQDYIAYAKSSFGFAPHAYADQGVGFSGITPMLGVWVTMRNLAYLFAVLAFVGIGFAVMLRVKIDPRTVMTIQNSIPKVIIGLVMITFSFAISGLLIDAMYSSVFVIYNIYASIPGIKPNLTPNLLQGNTPLGIASKMGIGSADTNSGKVGTPPLFIIPGDFFSAPTDAFGLGKIAWQVAGGLGGSFKKLLGIHDYTAGKTGLAWDAGVLLNDAALVNEGAARVVAGLTVFNDFRTLDIINGIIDAGAWIATEKFTPIVKDGLTGNIPVISGVINGLFHVPFAGGLIEDQIYIWLYKGLEFGLRNAAPVLIAWIIIFLALAISMIRLFFALLQAWLQTLFYIALGPLFILFGFIPKSKTGFGSWLRGLAANLLVFPITTAILLFGDVFIQEFSNAKNYYIPPLLGGQTLPVGPLLAVAVFFIAANGPAIAKGLVGQKDDKNTTGAFGVGIGGGIKIVTGTGKGISEFTAPVPGGAPGQRTGWRAFTREFLR